MNTQNALQEAIKLLRTTTEYEMLDSFKQKVEALNVPSIRGMFSLDKGVTSFCENHITRYWRFTAKGLKRKVEHFIETFDNDLKIGKKYYCYIDYGGCIADASFDTNNFKEAVRWMFERLKNYLINPIDITTSKKETVAENDAIDAQEK